MAKVSIIKNFPFLADVEKGIFEQATSCTEIELPDAWVADLRRKGYVGGEEVAVGSEVKEVETHKHHHPRKRRQS